MVVFIGVLILLASIFLGIFVLVQNPKGGGLSGTFGGFSNQMMGVRQTTDILEKGTWLLAIIIGVLCLSTAFFIPSRNGTTSQRDAIDRSIMNLPSNPNQSTSQPSTLPSSQNSNPSTSNPGK